MAPVRRSGFVDFGVNRIIKVHSQRVNGLVISAEEKKDKFLLVTKHADQEDMCNVWSIHKNSRISEYKRKLDEKLENKDDLSEEEINIIVKKYLRKIGGYLKCIDTLEDEEPAELEEEEEVLTAFEATDDDE